MTTAIGGFPDLRSPMLTGFGAATVMIAVIFALGASVEVTGFAGEGLSRKRYDMSVRSAAKTWIGWALWDQSWFLWIGRFLIFLAFGILWGLYLVAGSIGEQTAAGSVPTTTTLGDLYIANYSLISIALLFHTISEQLLYRSAAYTTALWLRVLELLVWVGALITVIITCTQTAPTNAPSEYGGILVGLIITLVLVEIYVIFVSTPRIIALHWYGWASEDVAGNGNGGLVSNTGMRAGQANTR